MEINPTYVNFKQAKLLKEKGFDVRLKKVYNILGELWDSHYQYMENSNPDCGAVCVAPEQWVVVEWLRVNHNIFIETTIAILHEYESAIYDIEKIKNYKLLSVSKINHFKTPQEAIASAIDYVLTNLI